MANALYDIWKQELLQGTANTALDDGNLKLMLVDAADYTFSQAHDFHADVAGGAIVATSGNLGSVTFTNGALDFADVTFTAVTGDPCEALILFIDTGSSATSRLVAYIDTGITGLPVTPGGGDITLAVHASGFFKL